MAGFWDGVGKVAKEIATGIWGDGTARALRSNLDEIGFNRVAQLERSATDDLIQTMTSNGVKLDKMVGPEGKQEKLLDLFKKNQENMILRRDEVVDNLSGMITDGDMNKKVIQEAIDNYKKGGDKYKNVFGDEKVMLKSQVTAKDASKYLGKENGELGVWNMATGYFGDTVNGATRGKTVAAGVAGTGIAVRYLSGGNLTTTPQGERDIAGIPFF